MAFFEKQGNINRVNREINKDLEDINKKYTEIGRIVKLRCLDQVDNEDVHRLAKEIDGLLNELLRLKEELNVINGIKICPKCNAQIDINVAFCPNCGTKQPANQQAAPAEAPAPAPVAAPTPVAAPAPAPVAAPAPVSAPIPVPDAAAAVLTSEAAPEQTDDEKSAEVIETAAEATEKAVTEAVETTEKIIEAEEPVQTPKAEIPAAPEVSSIPAPSIAPPVMPAPANIPDPTPAPAAPAPTSAPSAGQASIFCTQCGSKEPAGTRFCSQCGSRM